jgi:hypothetical protein
MSRHTRTLLLLALGIALVAMLLLAAGVSELQFLPGVSAPGSEEAGGETMGGISPELDEAFRTAFRIFATMIVVGLPLVIIYSLLTPEARKNLLKGMVPIVLFALFLYLAFRAGSNLEEQLAPTATVAPVATQATPEPVQTLEAVGGEIGETGRTAPEWLIWGAIVTLALIMALVLVGMGRFLLQYRGRQPSPLAELAEQAEDAVEAIRAGADLGDAVMLCYYRMSQTLRQQRGIWRETAMTPREFEAYLGQSGIPVEDVRRLTRLFEKVRYGAKKIGVEDEHQALSSLGAIIDYCRSVQ